MRQRVMDGQSLKRSTVVPPEEEDEAPASKARSSQWNADEDQMADALKNALRDVWDLSKPECHKQASI